jgi:hypothetical protein
MMNFDENGLKFGNQDSFTKLHFTVILLFAGNEESIRPSEETIRRWAESEVGACPSNFRIS